MSFRFLHLDDVTRGLMVGELDRDAGGGTLYLSPRLTDRGRRDWPELLREAARSGDELTLAEALRGTGRLRTHEWRRSRRGWGQYHEVSVPRTAAETLAEGEFNRFYIRGICLRALAEGHGEVEVYRAKAVRVPRPESAALLGRRLEAEALLGDLRRHSGEEEPCLGVPGGPNSGLSVRLPGPEADADLALSLTRGRVDF